MITAVSVVLWLGILQWPLPGTKVAAIVIFILSSPQIMQGLRLRQLGLLAGGLLALGAWCISKNHLTSAGISLGLATIKPQMAILPLAWFLFWAIGDWRKRWQLLAGFGTTVLILVSAGELILPGWIGYFIAELNAYRKYIRMTSLAELVLGKVFSEIIAIVFLAVLSAFAWRNRKCSGNSSQFTLVVAAFFLGAVIVLPLLPPFNEVLLILPALMIFQDWTSFRGSARMIFLCIVSWPWVVETVLLVARLRSDSSNHLPLLPSVASLLLPFILIILLAKHPTRDSQLPLSSNDLSLTS